LNHYRLYAITTGIMFLICLMTTPATADGNISTTDKYAWSENAGWLNHAPANVGGVVYEDHLEGYVWAENIGWIKLGSFIGGGTHPYNNSDNIDWGVNRSGSTLSGFAWSELVGWINFGPMTYGGVTFDSTTGIFDGWAWSENVGWVHFKNDSIPYFVSLQKYLLSLYFGGTGGVGSVNSDPAGINCSSDCSNSYFPGTVVTLTAATSTPQSTFDGWFGNCTGVASCLTAMTEDKYISVEFGLGLNDRGPMAKISTTGYRSVNDAYSAAGKNETILATAGTHDALVMNEIKNVTLKGGYSVDEDYNFTSQSGYTTISGSFRVSAGKLNAERIKIKAP